MRASLLTSISALVASAAALPATSAVLDSPQVNANWTVTWRGSYINRPYASFTVFAPDNYVDGLNNVVVDCNEISFISNSDGDYSNCFSNPFLSLDVKLVYPSGSDPYMIYVRHTQTDGDKVTTASGSSSFSVHPYVEVPVTDVTVGA